MNTATRVRSNYASTICEPMLYFETLEKNMIAMQYLCGEHYN